MHGLTGDRQLGGELRGGGGGMFRNRREQRSPGRVGQRAEHGAGAVISVRRINGAGRVVGPRHGHAATSAGP